MNKRPPPVNEWLTYYSALALFWSYVDTSAGEDGCWPWRGSRSREGYGTFHLPATCGKKPRYLYAHRLANFLATGNLAEATLHVCDNPPCCNPRHLKAGTRADNMRDAMEKGRWRLHEYVAGRKRDPGHNRDLVLPPEPTVYHHRGDT